MKARRGGGKWQTIHRADHRRSVQRPSTRKRSVEQDRRSGVGTAPIPGVQYDSTINKWHTCPNTDRINASNPCSEYMFLDDTACNLSSVLIKFLTKFIREDKNDSLDVRRRWLPPRLPRLLHRAGNPRRSLELPDAQNIAKNSHDYRPLGLGYANLGSLLMQLGVPYDSDEGARDRRFALTAIMCGHAFKASAEMAATQKVRSSASRRTASRCCA